MKTSVPKCRIPARFAANCLLGVALTLSSTLYASMNPTPGDPITLQSGKVSGTSLASEVRAYLGIPYAKPPVQGLRWAAPQPVQWSGVWNADRTGPECIQILRPHTVNHYFGEEPSGEDCLYLNIWAPENAMAGSKLPVVVFIYGGGGTVGSSGMAVYNGENVARHGAIFVSFNYRVGILGFMAHPELSAEQSGHSGNYGYLDQVAALKWINTNIEAFGGDATKVLITGQSFGAGSVVAHLFSPLSKGLFRAAAMWSACNFTDEAVSLQAAEKIGTDIQQRLLAANLKEMRAAAADKILALQEEHQLGANVPGLRLPAVIDGLFWVKDKRSVLQDHDFNDVPIMAGSNGDDIDAARNPLTTAVTMAGFKETAQKMYGAETNEFLKRYPVKTDGDVQRAAHEAARESGFLKNSLNCASLQTKYNRSPAYIELFTKRQPYVPGVVIADQDSATVGAYHTGDVPYWFDTFDAFNLFRPTRNWSAVDHLLSDEMLLALINMANTGLPSSPGLKWPAWTEADPEMAVFGDSVRIEKIPVARMKWLETHPANDTPRVGKPKATRD